MSTGADTAPAWPLWGHGSAEAAFLEAVKTGRLHHAWLVEGPSGIGKSRLVRRLAGYLLGARGAPASPLSAAASDPIVALMESGGHPDLRWIDRQPDEKGKLPQDIKVDAIRSLSEFFGLKPAQGGWRVGVIDAVDELNLSGANALLKTLEEPPAQAVLFLIYHGQEPILPTIRSRCRRLHLAPLEPEDTAAVLNAVGYGGDASLVDASQGRPGRALQLATPQGKAATASARAVLKALPRPSAAQTSDAIAKAGVSDEAFAAFTGTILDWASAKAIEAPEMAETWLWVSRTLADSREANMDRAQTTAKLLAGLQKAAGAG